MEGAEYKATLALEKRSKPRGLRTDLRASLPLWQNSWGLGFIRCFSWGFFCLASDVTPGKVR